MLVYDGSAISSVLTVTVRDLESGQGYWLAYRALNRAGWSKLSPHLKLVAGRLPHPPAQTPHQISVSPTSIEFGWQAPLDIGGAAKLDGYNVYRGKSLVVTLDPAILKYTLTPTTPGLNYSIRVASVTTIGEGAMSNPLSIWAIDLPSASTLSRTDTSQDSCSMAWTAPTPPANSLITGYILYVDDGLDGPYSVSYDGRDMPSKLAYAASKLVRQRQYRLYVTAWNKAGEGESSNIVTCNTVTVPGVPGTP